MIVYRSPDGQALVQLRAVAGTVWLAQAQIAALYDTSVPNIAQLIRWMLEDGEVSTATINSELRVQTEGTRRVQREVKIYNLDMVLAVGYRVTTPRAVQFRQWATTVLREYLVKGFVLDDPRLKDPAGTRTPAARSAAVGRRCRAPGRPVAEGRGPLRSRNLAMVDSAGAPPMYVRRVDAAAPSATVDVRRPAWPSSNPL